MLHRTRLAMQTGSFDKLDGEVEVDETYIGGKAPQHARGRTEAKDSGTGPMSKTAVLGIRRRDGDVRARVITDTERLTVFGQVVGNVEPGSALYTDAHKSYSGLDALYEHETVDHAERYGDGRAHTNGIENFWSLLKRGLHGTYVYVEPLHLSDISTAGLSRRWRGP